MGSSPHSRTTLAADFRRLGLGAGDVVMAHASLRSVGAVVSGADAIIAALRDAIGAEGTLLVYCDWEADIWDEATPEPGLSVLSVPPAIRGEVLPFDPAASRATRDNGALVELVRTLPGARRSGNPGASCAAIGARAEWLTEGHVLDYGYGPRSPFARLVEAGGKVLMLGCTTDHMTLLHHAEHLAEIPGKRIRRYEAPLLTEGGEVVWRWIEEYDTGDPVVAGLAEDYFATIVGDYLATGKGARGQVGDAGSVLVDAAGIVSFAVNWLESQFAR